MNAFLMGEAERHPAGLRRMAAAVCLTALGVGSSYPCAAQTSRSDPTDVQSRVGTQVTLDLPDKWLASFQYQARMVDDLSRYRGSYLYADVERGLGDHLAASADYRLALVDRGTYHRIGVGVEASGKIGRAKWSFRPRLQFQRQHFDGDDDFGSDDDVYLRTRAALKYTLSERWAVTGSVEPYFKFGADYPVDNWKNTLTLEYELTKGVKLDGFYAFRPDYGKSYNRTYHIVGTELEITVKVPRRTAAKAGQEP